MVGVIGKIAGVMVASGAVVAGFATPASAEPWFHPLCQPGARYAVGWQADGDWVFGRDCKADGYGINVIVIYQEDNGTWVDTGDGVSDHSSAGDGAWKSLSYLPEG